MTTLGFSELREHTTTRTTIISSPVPLAFYFNYGNILSQEVYDPTNPRTAMETLLRCLVVKQKSNVTFVTGTVRGFQRGARDEQRLSGIKIRIDGKERVEPADFVVGERALSHLRDPIKSILITRKMRQGRLNLPTINGFVLRDTRPSLPRFKTSTIRGSATRSLYGRSPNTL
jgi:hypothetical protein